MLIEKASLDPRSRFYIQPNRIVWQTSDNAAPKNSDLLLQPGSGQATLWARQGCILKNDGIAPEDIHIVAGSHDLPSFENIL